MSLNSPPQSPSPTKLTTQPPPLSSTYSSSSSPALIGKAGVCSIDVKYVEFAWRQPWQRLGQEAAAGTGFCIGSRRILTNAHVVASAVDVRVRLHGSPTRYKAHVVVFAPDVDLALLKLGNAADEEEFFYRTTTTTTAAAAAAADSGTTTKTSLALELATHLPNLQERVHVAGFPTGGTTICVTEGVVSRIDVRGVSPDGRLDALCIQIDAAINAGNSGGPVFNGLGQVTGVAFSKSKNGSHDNIGFIIAASTVRAFLSRCHFDPNDDTNATYTLAPSYCYTYCNLFNRSLRLAHQVPNHIKGVLLTSVSPTTAGQLQKGDVLTKVDDYELANDGQVFLRHDELISHLFCFSGKCLHEPVVFTVYRKGQLIQTQPVVLVHIPYLFNVFPHVDHQPDYLFVGPALFVPCSYGLAYQAKEPSSLLRGAIKKLAMQWPDEWNNGMTEVVLLIKIMAHDESFDYARPWSRAVSYNGTPIQSLRHLRDLWQASQATADADDDSDKHHFARVALEFQDDLIFEVKAATRAVQDVMTCHNIPQASVILSKNPKYRFTDISAYLPSSSSSSSSMDDKDNNDSGGKSP